MKIKLFFLLFLVFHIAVHADFGAKVYPNGIQTNPLIVVDLENFQKGYKQFENLAQEYFTEEQWKEFEKWRGDDPGEICAGQSLVFLLHNPPAQKQLLFPTSPEAMQQSAFFQSLNSLRNLSQHPRAKSQTEFQRLFPLLVNTKATALAEKNLQVLGFQEIYRSATTTEEFIEILADKFIEFIRNRHCSDLLIGYRFINKTGKPMGHMILLQLTHQRIFDPALGVYQYDNPGKMLSDLCLFFTSFPNILIEFESLGPL